MIFKRESIVSGLEDQILLHYLLSVSNFMSPGGIQASLSRTTIDSRTECEMSLSKNHYMDVHYLITQLYTTCDG
ncbi:unnamed protein product [Lactuca virosa]|uniref:Uncharacterized protein n=1 Tax=Lactuca virosa TaxID=75947 RepID=A0AAU9MCW8_9ASTR|nr:unnamed protein product [Lactuca virosa]